MIDKNMGFSTRAIHAGKAEDPSGALNIPIYQSATFRFDTCQKGGSRFAGEAPGFIYTRLGNPTTVALEERISALEGS